MNLPASNVPHSDDHASIDPPTRRKRRSCHMIDVLCFLHVTFFLIAVTAPLMQMFRDWQREKGNEWPSWLLLAVWPFVMAIAYTLMMGLLFIMAWMFKKFSKRK